ncbi:MAG: Hsp20/alpha crystallin family protein [Pseudomonadota bacterium]
MAASENVPVERSSPTDDNPIASMQRQVNRLFSDYMNQPLMSWFDADRWFSGAARPNVDMTETDNTYEVTAEVPGFEQKDVEVKITDGALVLEGKTESETEEKGKTWHRHERRFGSFSRSLPLPTGADQEKAKARLKNGVLTVTVPKKAEAKSSVKKIEIAAD